jgi:hypothetical protein
VGISAKNSRAHFLVGDAPNFIARFRLKYPHQAVSAFRGHKTVIRAEGNGGDNVLLFQPIPATRDVE